MTRLLAAGSLGLLLLRPAPRQAQVGEDADGRPDVPSAAARLVEAALEQTRRPSRYDGSYVRIPYPGGDVPSGTGVCTDVVIRAYRAIGLDLQVAVHEDMTRAFEDYPDRWGLRAPDPNIDHRRVPNLQAFFRRAGAGRPISADADDYRPGDVVTWVLPRGLPHVGLVVDRRSPDGERPLVVHDIGEGPALEDALFSFPITGHYRHGLDAGRPSAGP